MKQKDLFKKIDSLHAQLKKFLPMKPEDENRLWKKFRLEWNYNSNHMEGNTLTYGHTELLLIFDKVTGDYSGREIEEMKAHDVAIKMVVEYSTDKERDLNENFIRQLNQFILVRPYWKEAITPDGYPTRREIFPGEYKKYPNSVRLENGEIYNYSSPEETPALMHDLIQFYKTNAESSKVHPLWLSAMLHYKFVCIHPFDDGNGRVARLLMNYILMKNELPPVIIKDADKKAYLTALNKADTGDLDAFISYIGRQLEWSLKKAIDAAQGKSIDDENDIDKELELLKRENHGSEKVKIKKTRQVLQQIYQQSLKDLLIEIEKQFLKFNEFFVETQHNFLVRNAIENKSFDIPDNTLDYIDYQIFFDFNKPNIFGRIPHVKYKAGKPDRPIDYPDLFRINLNYVWKGYKYAGTRTFNLQADLEINFQEFKYSFTNTYRGEQIFEKLYDQPITETERKQISQKITRQVFEIFQEQIKNAKKS